MSIMKYDVSDISGSVRIRGRQRRSGTIRGVVEAVAE